MYIYMYIYRYVWIHKARRANATDYKYTLPDTHTWQWADLTHLSDTVDENSQIYK